VLNELEFPARDDRPWQEAAEEIAWRLRAPVAGYPGAATYLLTAAAPGPKAQRIMERLLELLIERAGLQGREGLRRARDARRRVRGPSAGGCVAHGVPKTVPGGPPSAWQVRAGTTPGVTLADEGL
jgi:hypothetical protein